MYDYKFRDERRKYSKEIQRLFGRWRTCKTDKNLVNFFFEGEKY